jgi:cytochrome c oxidase cbb3-type subunit 2
MTSHKIIARFILGMALAAAPAAWAQQSHIGSLSGDGHRGQELYRRYCVGCHGPKGDGKGENAPYVIGPLGDPPPRNFTTATYKCRSTPSGSIPYDSDIYNTITRGVHTTYMPSWRALTPQQRADLVAYVKTFSSRFKNEKPDPAIAIPAETAATPDSIARGKELYQNTLKCGECHGASGHGDGPSAPTLFDNLGNKLPPYDFTSGLRFKCGESDRDLYLIFLSGLDGTAMPSYADFLKGDQAWDLVHYLRTLQINTPNAGKKQ